MRTKFTIKGILLCAGLVAAGVATTAVGQSEREVRQEHERQAQRIKDLEVELKDLRARMAALEAALEALQAKEPSEAAPADDASPGSGPTATPEPTPPQGPTPEKTEGKPADNKALEDPARFLESLRVQFDKDLLKDPSFVLGINSPDKRALKEANTLLDAWIERMNRVNKKPIAWSVKILKLLARDNGDVVYTLQALSPDARPVGKPFLQPVPARIARRVAGWRVQPDLSCLVLKGLLQPRLTRIEQDPSGEDAGTEIVFENDGVDVNGWVRFDFSVRISSMMPIFVQPKPTGTAEEATGEP